MKKKRFIASPKMLIFFTVVVCLALASLVYYLADTFSAPVGDTVMTVFLIVLLGGLFAALLVIGITLGAFDVVSLRKEDVVLLRFGKKLRVYRLSQNTLIYVQKNHKGSQYIEVQFPEYFESAPQGFKSALMREGYVRISYSDSRLQYIKDVLQNYKHNIAPIEQPTQEW